MLQSYSYGTFISICCVMLEGAMAGVHAILSRGENRWFVQALIHPNTFSI